MNSSRGSEWRKWDLHVHTKYTNKNDQFTSKDFNSFCEIFFKKALEKNINAIGVTDYFSIDNYKKVIEYKDNIDIQQNFSLSEKEKIKQIFILPNVELRILPVTDSGRLINIHCLFNPNYIDNINNDFFCYIKYKNSDNEYPMTREGLIKLGKKIRDDSKISDIEAYIEGVNNFIVSYTDLRDLLLKNSNFRNNVIVSVSNSNRDGNSGYQKHFDLFENDADSSLDDVRKTIYCISDCIFSSNIQDILYFTGKKNDSKEKVKKKCGSLKPCIHGSDAHCEEKLFLPDNNRYCWIKSDLTFEGLKQIIYEPEDRVQIQQEKPEDKNGYFVIDSIKMKEEGFWNQILNFNENLNTIIGGRSTGKSNLLNSIAKKLNKYEEKDENKINFINKISNTIEIKWKDGVVDNSREIQFFPQHKMYELSRKENKKDLNKIIENVIKTKNKDIIEIYNNFKQNQEKIISNDIITLFSILSKVNIKLDEMKIKGDKEGIDKNIKIIKDKISNIKLNTSVSEEKIKEYNENKQKINDNNIKIKVVAADIEKLKNILNESIIKEDILINYIEISDYIKNKINQIIEYIKTNVSTTWNKKISAEIDLLSSKKESLEKEIQTIENKEEYKIIEQNIIINKEYTDLQDKLDKENNKIIEIEKDENEIKTYEEQIKNLKNKIIDEHCEYYKKINELEKSLKCDNYKIKIKSNVKVNKQSFIEALAPINLKIHSNYSIPNIDEEYVSDIKKFIVDLLNLALSNGLKLKNNNDIKTVLNNLISKNYFYIDYQLEYDSDNFETMSDGKKAFVILTMLLEFSNYDCPILIDQPEDSLDNRSIYNELSTYLKDKKKERQIILVTHNANIVVNTDAENIIVANQHGNNSKNIEGIKFQYVNGSLENTKTKDSLTDIILESQGIKEHVCEILEGGKEAFLQRERKYSLD